VTVLGNGQPPTTGLLAHSPKAFKYSGDIRRVRKLQTSAYRNPNQPRKRFSYHGWRPPFQITNNFLHISLDLIPTWDFCKEELHIDVLAPEIYLDSEMNCVDGCFVTPLNCRREGVEHVRMAVL
jgi:hypothetical protein